MTEERTIDTEELSYDRKSSKSSVFRFDNDFLQKILPPDLREKITNQFKRPEKVFAVVIMSSFFILVIVAIILIYVGKSKKNI
jgi:hypothetical protein